MKKFVAFLLLLSLTNSCVLARDYTKLQIKEMKKAQKYATSQNYVDKDIYDFDKKVDNNIVIKDPKILKIGDYKIIDDEKYNVKLKSDEKYYAKAEKLLKTKTLDNYNSRAKGADYYHVYRIAEKIIRANNLDYINWRIGFTRNAAVVNAYSTGTNYIDLTTAIYDTFQDNDDALAMLIGHEMGHSLLGHQKRLTPEAMTVNRLRNVYPKTYFSLFWSMGYLLKYRVDAKNAEFAADLEGVKLAMKAGYDVKKGQELFNYMDTLPRDAGYRSDHPSGDRRIQNVADNYKYFPKEAWKDAGKYNIYTTEPLKVNLSSDRKSIVINADTKKYNADKYYMPETISEIYIRMAYTAYTRGDFENSIKYFNELFKIDKSNASAYLYASYASEALYKKTGKKCYLDDAKVYAESAKILEPKNKYVLEQINDL